jgi:hypothetical protein
MSREPEPGGDRGERPQQPPESTAGIMLVVAALLVAGVIAAWLWRSQRPVPQETPVAAAPEAPPAPQPAASAAAPAASAQKYPLAEAAEQPSRGDEVTAALSDLLGAKAVSSFRRRGRGSATGSPMPGSRAWPRGRRSSCAWGR